MARRKRKGGLFKRLFGKRKGGSPGGNFLRRIGDVFSGGLVSDILPAAKEDGKWIAEMRANGVKFKDVEVGIKSHVSDKELAEVARKTKSGKNKESMLAKIKYYFTKKPVAAIGTVVSLGFAVYYFFFKKKNRKSW